MDALSARIRQRVAEALAEDMGAGDRTTEWSVDASLRDSAGIFAKEEGVIAGLAAAAEVYRQLGGVEFEPGCEDGDAVLAGACVARVNGLARAILTGERTALNFLGRLSGVATLTQRFVAAIDGTPARITDTRKTTPLWRELERAATRAGGAVNHRPGLDAMVLLKENHLACAGGITAAVEAVLSANREGLKVEVEVTDLEEVAEALNLPVDRIMLDNMALDEVAHAVHLIRKARSDTEIEASGGVRLDTVRALADTGVDLISVGALTHSARALDLSLRMIRVGS